MMRSRDLSKKVLVSLLTMSYVYLGGDMRASYGGGRRCY